MKEGKIRKCQQSYCVRAKSSSAVEHLRKKTVLRKKLLERHGETAHTDP